MAQGLHQQLPSPIASPPVFIVFRSEGTLPSASTNLPTHMGARICRLSAPGRNLAFVFSLALCPCLVYLYEPSSVIILISCSPRNPQALAQSLPTWVDCDTKNKEAIS